MVVTLGRGALARVDLVLSQGATNRYRFRYSTGEPGFPEPVDLTGWTARCQFRRSAASAEAWSTFTGDHFALDGDGGVTLTVPYAETESAYWDTRDGGVYDVELTSPAGERVRLVEGAFAVSHDVTRGA